MRKSNHLIFYVYILFDWLGIPRYVGKGQGKRWLNHERTTNYSNLLMNEFIEQTWIILEDLPKIKIRENLTEKEALETEIALIAAIGRKDLGKGPLLNLTDGGEGLSGHIISERTRRLKSQKAKAYTDRLPPEEKSRRAKLAYNSLTKEQKIEMSRRAARSTTRSGSMKQYLASLTPEERSERAKKSYEGRPPESKNTAEKWHAMMTPEKLIAMGKTASEHILLKSTAEERSERARKREENKTPEQRRLDVQKGLATRRQRGTDKNMHSAEKRREIALKGWATRKLNEITREEPSQ